MELADARSLLPQTQQALRQRPVAAVVEQGRAPAASGSGVGRGAPHRQSLGAARSRPWGTSASRRQAGMATSSNWKRSLRSSGISVGSSCPDRWWATTCAAWCALCHAKFFKSWTFIRASSPPGAAVSGPARRPNRVVLPAALQSRTQPGRVLEPGHMIVIYLG